MKRLVLTLAFVSAACASTLPAPRTTSAAATPRATQQDAARPSPAPAPSTPAAPPVSALPNARGSVKFAVIGDTGTGGREQYDVGKLLAAARARFPYDFVIMVGDNMYGSERPDDFEKKFAIPYKPLLDAGVKFYAALGNHDDPAQRFYKPFNMDGKRYYTFNKGDVDFFVLDSTYMSPVQLDWLKGELEKSKSRWKIAYFHHPLYSSGRTHGSETDLRTLIEPLFIKSGVDVVFAGHEHFYERVKPQNGIYYFTEGGSAKLREGNIRTTSALTEKGFDSDNTFMLVEIDRDQLFFETISRSGEVIDSGSLKRREPARGVQTQ